MARLQEPSGPRKYKGMQKIKIADAPNIAINWLVAKAEGHPVEIRATVSTAGKHLRLLFNQRWVGGHERWDEWRPTTDPAQAWPIIDRHPEMQLYPWGGEPDERAGELQCACLPAPIVGGARYRTWFGKTKIIAAMRCYCASKYGDEVEVPEELLA